MLRLIDGTELTEEVKEAFKRGVVKCYIKLEDGTIIDNNNYLQNVKFEDLRYNEETNEIIGEAIAKRVTVTIYNENNEINIENKEFELYVGAVLLDESIAWINFGKYIVQKPENNDTKEKSEFKALDYMCKFNKEYVMGVTLPCTYAEFAEDVCNQCGVELGSKDFRNADQFIYRNPFIDGEQCRFVIKTIAKDAFSWARIKTDNKLYFDFVQKDMDEPDELITLDDYIEFGNNEKTIPINTVVLRNSNIETEHIMIYDDALISEYGKQKALIVKEDYFAYNQETRQYLIEAGRELIGLVYYPLNLKGIGSIYLDSNDVIGVQNKKGFIKSTYCFNHTFEYNGALYDSIDSPSMTETEEKYKHESQSDLDKRRTEIAVDKANQRIQSIVTQIGDRTNKTTSITQDLEDIEIKVNNVAGITDELNGINKLVLNECMRGNLLEFRIYGNNSVFNTLKVGTFKVGQGVLLVTGEAEFKVTGEELNDLGEVINTTETIYNLGKIGALRQIDDVYDEFILEGGVVRVVRRIGITEDGTTYIRETPIIQEIGEWEIPLVQGRNTIEILYYTADMYAKWVILNDYTNMFATTVELESAIELAEKNIELSVTQKVTDNIADEYATKELLKTSIELSEKEITAEVNKKVDEKEIIAKINLAVENKQGIINITGNQVTIDSDYFTLDKTGKITASSGVIGGLTLEAIGEDWSDFYKIMEVNGERYQSGLWIPQNAPEVPFLYAGLNRSTSDGNKFDANAYITHNGLMYAKWFEVNGESGYFKTIYNNGQTSMLFNKDGIFRYLSNGNYWDYQGILYENGAPYCTGIMLNDSQRFQINDDLHDMPIAFFQRGISDDNSMIWFYGNCYIDKNRDGTGYEIATIDMIASDKKLKTNIENCTTESLPIIRKIDFKQFDWNKEESGKEGHVDIGTIAQDLEKINSNYVTKSKKVTDKGETEILSIDILNLVNTGLKAIQELDKKIEKRDKIIEFLAEKLNCKDEVLEMLEEGE